MQNLKELIELALLVFFVREMNNHNNHKK